MWDTVSLSRAALGYGPRLAPRKAAARLVAGLAQIGGDLKRLLDREPILAGGLLEEGESGQRLPMDVLGLEERDHLRQAGGVGVGGSIPSLGTTQSTPARNLEAVGGWPSDGCTVSGRTGASLGVEADRRGELGWDNWDGSRPGTGDGRLAGCLFGGSEGGKRGTGTG